MQIRKFGWTRVCVWHSGPTNASNLLFLCARFFTLCTLFTQVCYSQKRRKKKKRNYLMTRWWTHPESRCRKAMHFQVQCSSMFCMVFVRKCRVVICTATKKERKCVVDDYVCTSFCVVSLVVFFSLLHAWTLCALNGILWLWSVHHVIFFRSEVIFFRWGVIFF